MNELIKNIPWDKLTEQGVIAIVTMLLLYFILKLYIDHKTNNLRLDAENKQAELKGYFDSQKQELMNELQSIKQEVTQIRDNRISASDVSITENTQLESNEISNGSKVTVTQRNRDA